MITKLYEQKNFMDKILKITKMKSVRDLKLYIFKNSKKNMYGGYDPVIICGLEFFYTPEDNIEKDFLVNFSNKGTSFPHRF